MGPAAHGMFVALEGGEGAGKSTLLRALASALREHGREVTTTREPGATAVGARLRELLLDPASAGLDPRAEALLYAADRADHVAQVVRPALAAGHVVLCDRYVDSSIAYQGAARGLGEQAVADLSTWGTGGLVPDLTIVLDVAPDLGLVRARRRSAGTADRLEAEAGAFHQAVRRSFLDRAAADPGRYLVLDASRPPARLLDEALSRVQESLAFADSPPAPAVQGSAAPGATATSAGHRQGGRP